MRGESVTMMLEPNYCLQHRDLWDLVTSRDGSIGNMKMGRGESGHTSTHPAQRRQRGTNIPHLPIYPCFMLTVCREYLIFSSNVSDCFSIISWKPSYWVHLTYHRISFHVLPSQRARCSIEWVNKMQHTSPAHSTAAGLSFIKWL